MTKNDQGPKPPQGPIDPAERWQSYLAKCAEIETAFREILNLDDVRLHRLGQRYALAAMPSPKHDASPPRGPSDQQVRRELLRIERNALAALAGRLNADERLRAAIMGASSIVRSELLPFALILAVRLPNVPRERVERLADRAAALAQAIAPANHPGGRRPAKIGETALAILLAQDFEMLTGKKASVFNRDLEENSPYDSAPFMLLIECVFATIGLAGSPRKAAERALAHLAETRPRTDNIVDE